MIFQSGAALALDAAPAGWATYNDLGLNGATGGGGGWTYDKNGKRMKQFRGTGDGSYLANFIKAVRSRKVSDLNADIVKGHIFSTLCDMGNISYLIGQQAQPNQILDLEGSTKAPRVIISLDFPPTDVVMRGAPLKPRPMSKFIQDEYEARYHYYRI